VFGNEYMTGTSSYDPRKSKITLAFLEDSGWYRANYSNADSFPYGRGEGCSFSSARCSSWYVELLFVVVFQLMSNNDKAWRVSLRSRRRATLGLHIRSQSTRSLQRQRPQERRAAMESLLQRQADVGRRRARRLLSDLSVQRQSGVGLSCCRLSTGQLRGAWRGVWHVVALSRLDAATRDEERSSRQRRLVSCLLLVSHCTLTHKTILLFSYGLRCYKNKLYVRVVYDFYDCVRIFFLIGFFVSF
jgi:hypothetical protein